MMAHRILTNEMNSELPFVVERFYLIHKELALPKWILEGIATLNPALSVYKKKLA